MAYSDAEKAQALIRLAANGNDLDKTAVETGVASRTLKRWTKLSPKKAETVAEGLEFAIKELLSNIPRVKGQEWGVTLGILIDKWLLMSGRPTSRAENITRKFGGLTEDEFADVIDEANEILAQAAGSSPDPGHFEDPE